MWRAWILGLVLVLAGCDAEVEEPRLSAQSSWAEKAKVDGAYALDLLEANHPGALAVVGDGPFRQALDQARRRLGQRAPQVEDRGGYEAVMRGLFEGFRDPHLRWRPYEVPDEVQWPGFILVRRQGDWRVGAVQGASARLEGAVLQACDGQGAEVWATTRIEAFADDAAVEANLKRQAGWLMLDEGNPFMARAGRCQFQGRDGGVFEQDLDWQPISRADWRAVQEAVEPRADAGLGLEALGGGFWIGLNSLEGVGDLIDEVERQGAALRASAFVVVDLRGNMGGSSQYTSRLYSILVGRERALRAQTSPNCGSVYYRISKGNLAYMRQAWGGGLGLKAELRRRLRQDFNRVYRPCPVPSSLPVEARAAGEPRLVLVIDRNCFSSCLLAVAHGRRLGAVLVGESTPVNLAYLEARGLEVPSGLGRVFTMMGLVTGMPDFGPYQPEHPYAGSMADSGGLKDWVVKAVLAAEPA